MVDLYILVLYRCRYTQYNGFVQIFQKYWEKIGWEKFAGTQNGMVVQLCWGGINRVATLTLGQLSSCHPTTMIRKNWYAWCSVVCNRRMDTVLACRNCKLYHGPVYYYNPILRKCFYWAHKYKQTRQYIFDNTNRTKKLKKNEKHKGYSRKWLEGEEKKYTKANSIELYLVNKKGYNIIHNFNRYFIYLNFWFFLFCVFLSNHFIINRNDSTKLPFLQYFLQLQIIFNLQVSYNPSTIFHVER